MKKERRFHKGIELRANGDAMPHIIGYAAVFNAMSQDLGGFFEVIEPGSFTQVLSGPDADGDYGGPDCRDLFNHDVNFVLGRTESGTLVLAQNAPGTDPTQPNGGLSYDCDPPATQTVRDFVITPIQRGDIDGSSFSFMVDSADWNETFKGQPVRRITSFSLLDDVSQVTYPAYPAASTQLRSLLGDIPTAEEIALLKKNDGREDAHDIELMLMLNEVRMRRFRLRNL